MHLREKIGSLFVVGFDGTAPTPELNGLIQDYLVGGVIIFRRNIASKDQLTGLIAGIKEASEGRPLIISVDHEGGRVFRLPKPFTQIGPMAFIKGADEAYESAKTMAVELKEAGFNLNFAPVLDVNTNVKNPVIGDRSFSNNPSTAARLGASFIKGLQENGIIACGKHFPGHGDTSLDSHTDIPTLPHTMGRLESVELVPFKAAIDADVGSIMTAHVIYEGIDPKWPATLSPLIVNRLLRYELGYSGVVFSDDLLMNAISKRWPLSDACVKSLRAGCDICLISKDAHAQREAIEYAIHAVNAGILPESVIDAAYRRISKLFRP